MLVGADVRREPGPQEGLGVRIELRIAGEHLAEGPDRLDDRAARRAEVATLPLDRHHSGHVGEDVGEEADVQAMLGNVEGLISELVEGQVLEDDVIGHGLTLSPEAEPALVHTARRLPFVHNHGRNRASRVLGFESACMVNPHTPHGPTQLLREAFGLEPFSVARAETIGVPRHQLRAAERAGRVTRLRRGWYVVAPTRPSREPTSHAVVPPGVAGPPAVATGFASPPRPIAVPNVDAIPRDCLASVDRLRDRSVEAVMTGSAGCLGWGVDVVGVARPPVILVPASSGVRAGRQGSVLIRHDEPPEHHVLRLADGRMIASPARSALDYARGLSDIEAFVTVNSAARALVGVQAVGEADTFGMPHGDQGRELAALAADPERAARAIDELHRTYMELHGHGVRRLGGLFRLLEPRLEGALESISWWRFDEFGVPVPVPQAWVRGSSGRLYRVDFLWGALVGEADGLGKYADQSSVMREKRRQTDIELPGRSVIRWGWDEAWRHPERLAQEIARRQSAGA